MGDIHYGSALCDEALLQETLNQIKHDGRAIVFLMGDLCDSILPSDKRFEAGLVADWIDPSDVLGSQVRGMFKLLKPIAHKIVGVLDGNHEEKVKKEQSFRIKRELIERARELGFAWKDLSYSALVKLSFEWTISKKTKFKHALTIYLHHGWGGGRGHATNHYVQAMASFDADWFVFGHTHGRYAHDAVYHKISLSGHLLEERRLWGRSGSFLKTVAEGDEAGYSEQKGYMPLPRGCLCIRHYPHLDKDGHRQMWSWMGDSVG